MNSHKENVAETAAFLKAEFGQTPRAAIFTGTGLGEIAGLLQSSVSIPYRDIPHFPISTVESHIGKLVFGTLHGKPVMMMQGRFHLYEGYSPAEVTYPVRVMRELGVKVLILTNASGGLNPKFNQGDLMLITDHINLTGANPLIGHNEDIWGVRFPDMSEAYDRKLIGIAEKSAKKAGILLQKGVYAGLKGPSLETPAEIRFLKLIGADAVGFSTVQEVIAAVHSGIRVLGIATITNVHDPDRPVPAKLEDIIATAQKAAPKLESLISAIMEEPDDIC